MSDVTAPARRLPRDLRRPPSLHVVYSADAAAVGRRLRLDGRVWTLGREGADEARIEDPRLSREHARLDLREGRYRIEDLESSNGTFVGGAQVREAPLEPGVVVRLGDTLLAYDASVGRDQLPAADGADPEAAAGFVGVSAFALAVRRSIHTVAPLPGAVLVLGASGTGKEIVAGELHRLSGRGGEFVALNCGALSPELAEAELFGHAAGAFTGAREARPGLFVQADGGTLFLDEIGEMPRALQVKLLRVLETSEVRPVGGSRTRTVDVRVVAATNADPGTSLRVDLLARLQEWPLTLSPLRERRCDVLALASHFGHERLTAEAAEALLLHDWPANVRELRKLLSRVSRLSEVVDLDVLPPALRDRVLKRGASPSGKGPSRVELEAALRRHGGVVSKVAAEAGVDRTQVYRWLRRLSLDPGAFR